MKTNSDIENVFNNKNMNTQPKYRISKMIKKKNSQIYKLKKLPTENYENDENKTSIKKTNIKNKNENTFNFVEKNESVKRRAKKSILKTPSIGIKAIMNKVINSPKNNDDKNIPLSLFKHLKNLSPLSTETDYLSKS
jgi:hypothetical protein